MFLGDYRIEIIPDTEFRLDGGAMFGVVPRVVWERVCPPDELNRIHMNMNCLFIETPTEKILIETGIGEKWSDKNAQRYGIYREKPFAQSLKEVTGYQPKDITIVVNTHLHFDHAGGNTILDEKGKIVPNFPNARYFVSKNEFEQAENPHERHRASYLKENWACLIESGQLELKNDVYEVVEGLTMETVRGHSETMQCVRLNRGGQTLYSFADLIPTRHHLPFAWVMGYDLFPVETLEAKKKLLPQALKENWLCYFYHDLDSPLCRLIEVDGKLKTVKYEN
ncbi:MAG: MBL fold metallo-hydrolase [Pyrinomonadaceae bacterium]|jgi:glyoxylase-like metal-dependent hydrolase (beta-lactamase superfamily II)|nr:MBL fold metallo-hydrolase [Pyrinomonadaceae bacterium]